MKKLLSPIPLALVVGALALAGCGSDNSDNSGSDAAAQSTGTATDTGNAAGSTGGGAGDFVKVSMKNIEFVPDKVSAKVGQTVEWTNDDGVAHTVTDKADGIDSGTVNPGSTFKFKVAKAGTLNYVCTIHAGQKGTITAS
jgi:plastocyanin